MVQAGSTRRCTLRRGQAWCRLGAQGGAGEFQARSAQWGDALGRLREQSAAWHWPYLQAGGAEVQGSLGIHELLLGRTRAMRRVAFAGGQVLSEGGPDLRQARPGGGSTHEGGVGTGQLRTQHSCARSCISVRAPDLRSRCVAALARAQVQRAQQHLGRTKSEQGPIPCRARQAGTSPSQARSPRAHARLTKIRLRTAHLISGSTSSRKIDDLPHAPGHKQPFCDTPASKSFQAQHALLLPQGARDRGTAQHITCAEGGPTRSTFATDKWLKQAS